MANVKGISDPRFEKLKTFLQDNIASGEEVGASIAVNFDGKMVVDMYGGFTNAARTQPWTQDTIVNVWSSTKTVTALAILMLHDRGLLDVDDNVSKYWPEFAANGKENIKIRHILSHTSGVSGWEDRLTPQEVYDTKAASDRLARQSPWWEPGAASGYHATTMGHLLGELVRRVSGKTLKQFIEENIAGPTGADFQIGAKEVDWHRIAEIIPPEGAPPLDFSKLDRDSITLKTFLNTGTQAADANTPEWRRAELGAVNGHTNARALCTILSAITLGGSTGGSTDGSRAGHKLLSQKTIDRIFEEQFDGVDLVLGAPVRFGIGYGIAGGGHEKTIRVLPGGKDRRICFWHGWGGSWALMDLDRRVTMAYTMNKMGSGIMGSERSWGTISALYAALDSA